jgi:hypothetical protein
VQSAALVIDESAGLSPAHTEPRTRALSSAGVSAAAVFDGLDEVDIGTGDAAGSLLAGASIRLSTHPFGDNRREMSRFFLWCPVVISISVYRTPTAPRFP